MVSGQIGEAGGGAPKPPAGTRPCARPGAAARGHPQPWKRPCTHKTPAANFSSSQLRLSPRPEKETGGESRARGKHLPAPGIRAGGAVPQAPRPADTPVL